ncbi:MAG: hypothetical protein N2749_05550 [Clostridia bacterium]|nr:hypothetical protein [Clostridia bacterium]
MELTESLKKFLINSAVISGTILIYTDLNKVIFCSKSELVEIGKEISSEYKRMVFELDQTDKPFWIAGDNEDNILDYTIYGAKDQIIIPIKIKNELIGSVCFISQTENYDMSNIPFFATSTRFIKELIKSKN